MTTRLATAALTATLAFAATAAPEAQAAAVQSYAYSTDGSISGMAGVSPIYFEGEYGQQTLNNPGGFVLGTFVTAGILPPTATLTYNDTPFTIDLVVASSPSAAGSSTYLYGMPTYNYQISGMLNGSITGAGWSDMVATVTSITGSPNSPDATPPFPASDLTVLAPQGIAAPNGFQDGTSTLTAYVSASGTPLPTPAPEPTSIAAFAAALVGWSIRRRLLARS